MLWVGLATLIMLLTGAGDDTRTFRKRAQMMEKRVQEVVHDEKRKAQALAALHRTSKAFWEHRDRLDTVGKCLAKLDADYHATRSEYERCYLDSATIWATAATELIVADKSFRGTLNGQEWASIREVMKP